MNMPIPPFGCSSRQEGDTHILRASTYSWEIFFLLPFTVVWSPLACVVYAMQIDNGFSLALSLLGLPFLVATIFLWWQVLMAIFGKVEIRIHQRKIEAFTGIGTLGFKKHYDASVYCSIQLDWGKAGKGMKHFIALDGAGPRVEIGRELSTKRREWLCEALRAVLERR